MQIVLMKTELKMLMELAVVLFGGAALESFFRKKDRLAMNSKLRINVKN